jgi:hypothetical protein
MDDDNALSLCWREMYAGVQVLSDDTFFFGRQFFFDSMQGATTSVWVDVTVMFRGQ